MPHEAQTCKPQSEAEWIHRHRMFRVGWSGGKHTTISSIFSLDATSNTLHNPANLGSRDARLPLGPVSEEGGLTHAVHAWMDRAVHQSGVPSSWCLAARGCCARRLLQQLPRAHAQRPTSAGPAPSFAATLAGRLSPGRSTPLALLGSSPTQQRRGQHHEWRNGAAGLSLLRSPLAPNLSCL